MSVLTRPTAAKLPALRKRGMAGAPGAGSAAAGLSIVVPLFNEADGLRALHGRLTQVARALREARGLACEFVYVDDGSRDATGPAAEALAADGVAVQGGS